MAVAGSKKLLMNDTLTVAFGLVSFAPCTKALTIRLTSGIGIAPTTPMVFDFVSPPASIPARYAGSCSQLSKTLRFGDCGFSPDPNANGMSGNSAATLRTASSAANASPMIASGFSLVAMSRNPRSIASAVARLSTCLYSMSPFAAAWFSAAWIAPSHGSSSGVAKTPYTSGLSPPPELAPPAGRLLARRTPAGGQEEREHRGGDGEQDAAWAAAGARTRKPSWTSGRRSRHGHHARSRRDCNETWCPSLGAYYRPARLASSLGRSGC